MGKNFYAALRKEEKVDSENSEYSEDDDEQHESALKTADEKTGTHKRESKARGEQDERTLAVGDMVRIHSLVIGHDFNGIKGELVRMEASGRWRVKLDFTEGSKNIAIKPQNLTCISSDREGHRHKDQALVGGLQEGDQVRSLVDHASIHLVKGDVGTVIGPSNSNRDDNARRVLVDFGPGKGQINMVAKVHVEHIPPLGDDFHNFQKGDRVCLLVEAAANRSIQRFDVGTVVGPCSNESKDADRVLVDFGTGKGQVSVANRHIDHAPATATAEDANTPRGKKEARLNVGTQSQNPTFLSFDQQGFSVARGCHVHINCLEVKLSENAGINSNICSMTVGTDGTRFVCTNSALIMISPTGRQALLAGHTTETGFLDGKGGNARFNSPHGIAVDCVGNVFMADTLNNALRKIMPNGAVLTIAGNGQAGFEDGVGVSARFSRPWGIVVDARGTIYVTECDNDCVRQVDQLRAVSTLAGRLGPDDGEDCWVDGQGNEARFFGPTGLALNMDGHLIVADSSNNCIRMVTTDEGRVTTVAGSGIEDDDGFEDGGCAVARFCDPCDIAVDANNNILVADVGNNCIRMIAGTDSCVTTVMAGRMEDAGLCQLRLALGQCCLMIVATQKCDEEGDDHARARKRERERERARD